MGFQAVRWSDCLTIAGSLTFTAMLALVPVMTVVYLGLAFLPEFALLAEQVERFVFQNFVPSSSAAVQEKLNEFAARAGDLTTVGLIGLTITALGLLLGIERHFNALWHVSMPRLSIRRLATLVGLLTVGPSLVLRLYGSQPTFCRSRNHTGCDRCRANVAERVASALFIFSVQYLIQGRTKRRSLRDTRCWVGC